MTKTSIAPENIVSEILVLGCSRTGKTLLVRQLRRLCGTKVTRSSLFTSDTSIPTATAPTVGVEVDTLSYKNKFRFVVREVGYPMAEMWNSYHASCQAVIVSLRKQI